MNIFQPMANAVSEFMSAFPGAEGTGILSMVLHAGPLVKAVMAGLFALSLVCWGIIVAKAHLFRKTNRESEKFIDQFVQRKNFDTLHREIGMLEESHLAAVFRGGYAELERVSGLWESKGLQALQDYPEILLENVGRAIQGRVISKRKRLQRFLPFLATTGSTAPFIGLFGTVWGIMNSFQDIGIKGSASLEVVAPGISEALIATAMGLAAAIPAVVAYNHFANKIQAIEDDMLHFSSDFLNALRTDLMCRERSDEVAVRHQTAAAR
ncbi:MAG: protein TolQ [Syntrophobacteraceae bacterium]